MKKLKNLRGFTLIELLIVIAVMAILTTVVFVALDPTKRFVDSRNTRRWTDVNTIIGAIKLHQVDNGGLYLTEIENATAALWYQIGTATTGCNDTCAGTIMEASCIDLSTLITSGKLPKMPFDPQGSTVGVVEADGDVEESRYYLRKEANGAITIGSCAAEAVSGGTAPTIEVTR